MTVQLLHMFLYLSKECQEAFGRAVFVETVSKALSAHLWIVLKTNIFLSVLASHPPMENISLCLLRMSFCGISCIVDVDFTPTCWPGMLLRAFGFVLAFLCGRRRLRGQHLFPFFAKEGKNIHFQDTRIGMCGQDLSFKRQSGCFSWQQMTDISELALREMN